MERCIDRGYPQSECNQQETKLLQITVFVITVQVTKETAKTWKAIRIVL